MKIEELKIGDVIAVPMEITYISKRLDWINVKLSNGEEDCFGIEHFKGATFISKVPRTKKVKVEKWIKVFSDGSSHTYSVKEHAEEDATPYRIACEHFVKEYEIPE